MRVAVGQYLFFLFFLVVQHWEAGFSSATENVAAPVSSPKVSAGAQSPRAADAPQQPFAAAPTKPEQNERSTAAAVEKVATPAVSRKPKAAAALYGLLTLLFLGLSLYSVSWEEELEESDDDEGEGDGAEYRSISVVDGFAPAATEEKRRLLQTSNLTRSRRRGKRSVSYEELPKPPKKKKVVKKRLLNSVLKFLARMYGPPMEDDYPPPEPAKRIYVAPVLLDVPGATGASWPAPSSSSRGRG